MKKSFKSRVRRLMAVPIALIALATTAVGSLSASADDSVNSKVKDAQEGVYSLQLFYTDQASGKKFSTYGGTCFFINDDTLITSDHVISLKDEEEKAIETEAKRRFNSYDRSNISYEVMLQADVSVPASVVAQSANDDWAVLQVRDALNTKPLKIGNSKEAQNTQTIYAIGFPEITKNWASTKSYSKSDITTTKGQITKIYQELGSDLIQHSATISGGNSGGPLVDEQGAVIGVNRGSKDNYYTAVAMEQIVDVLDQRKISYTRYDGSNSGEQTTTSAVEPAPDSTAAPETSQVTTAVPAVTDASSTADVPGKITTASTDDKSSSGMDTKTIILIVAGGIVLILIVVIVIVAVSGKKKPKQIGYSQTRPQTPPPAAPVQAPRPIQPQAPLTSVQQPSNFQQTTVNSVGETTVLSSGAVGETTVLGGIASPFSVVRRKTNETVSIGKSMFVIGKDTTADYCISGNTSISRNHAKFIVRNGQCFVTDMRSTNGTFVNGTRVAPNQEVPLKAGDIIKLSDEEFEFKA